VTSLLDIGCNTGRFATLAATRGIEVVAIDSDMDCVEQLYTRARAEKLNILPLCADITNPSPAIGWDNCERQSLLNRLHSKFDCVFALALVHHLLVTKRVPVEYFAMLERDLTRQFLITEFVGRDDAKFRQLLRYRSESYDYYDLDFFREIHAKHFEILDEIILTDEETRMDRAIFLMRKLPT
jgi:SAM-dependent methyltransferase